VGGLGNAVVAAAATASLLAGGSMTTAAATATPAVVINLTPLTQPAVAAAAAAELPPEPFAKTAGLPLLPLADKVVRYTYHESMFSEALPLRPRGRAKFVGHPNFRAPKRTPGPKYFVLPSRGRGTGSTTATDVVLRKGTKVASPVSGKVVATTDYRLYCRRPDTRIILRPQGRGRQSGRRGDGLGPGAAFRQLSRPIRRLRSWEPPTHSPRSSARQGVPRPRLQVTPTARRSPQLGAISSRPDHIEWLRKITGRPPQ